MNSFLKLGVCGIAMRSHYGNETYYLSNEVDAALAAKDAEIAAKEARIAELERLTRLVLERAERVDKWTCGRLIVPQHVQQDALAIISLAADMLHPDAHQEPKP